MQNISQTFTVWCESEYHVFLQIDQKSDEPWPLTIIDFEGKKDKLYFEPGEMLFFEACKLLHGRQFPFKGEFYDNFFVHFRLRDQDFDASQFSDLIWILLGKSTHPFSELFWLP